MIAVWAALVGALAARPVYEVDWTGLSVDRPVQAHAPDCSIVPGTRVLRGALVTYSRKGGLSTWGHSAMRFQVCTDARFRDVEFEAARYREQIRRLRAHEPLPVRYRALGLNCTGPQAARGRGACPRAHPSPGPGLPLDASPGGCGGRARRGAADRASGRSSEQALDSTELKRCAAGSRVVGPLR